MIIDGEMEVKRAKLWEYMSFQFMSIITRHRHRHRHHLPYVHNIPSYHIIHILSSLIMVAKAKWIAKYKFLCEGRSSSCKGLKYKDYCVVLASALSQSPPRQMQRHRDIRFISKVRGRCFFDKMIMTQIVWCWLSTGSLSYLKDPSAFDHSFRQYIIQLFCTLLTAMFPDCVGFINDIHVQFFF